VRRRDTWAFSAAVTQRWYRVFTATWRATYVQRKARFGGSHEAASESRLALLVGPSTARRLRGSLARAVR
jgi:hypothetical protein